MLFNEQKFREKYGFDPHQMIDYKALRGDPSDNIPGVKGVGDKTAKDLIKQFGSIEEIYKNLDKVMSAALRKKLETDKEKAFLSKQLATIITDIPMDFDLKKCEVHDFDPNQVRALFDELEFKSLMKRLDRLEMVKDVKDKMSREGQEEKQKQKQGTLF